MNSHLLTFAEAVAADTALTVAAYYRGESATNAAVLARDAVMRAFGCICWHPGDPTGVYAEDMACQLHNPRDLDQPELVQVLEEAEDDDDGIPPQGKPGRR